MGSGSDDAKNKTKIDIQILQVSPRELGVGNNLNLAVTLLANLHRIAEIANTVVDFDLVVQKFFKGGDIEDLVRGRLGCVYDVLYNFSHTHNQSAKTWKLIVVVVVVVVLGRFCT